MGPSSQFPRQAGGRWRPGTYSKGPHRLGDILYVLRAEIIIVEMQAAERRADRLGHTDATGLRQAFQARRDIDAVPLNIVAINDHVTEMDTDTVADLIVQGAWSLRCSHLFLYSKRAPHRFDDAREFLRRFRRP